MYKTISVFFLKQMWNMRGSWFMLATLFLPMIIMSGGDLGALVDIGDYKAENVRIQKIAVEEQNHQEFVESMEKWLLTQKFSIGNQNISIPSGYAKEYAKAIASSKYPMICAAVFKVESRFNPFAISKAGAMGPAQIMPMHVEELKESNIIEEKNDLFMIQNAVLAFDYMIEKKLNSKRGQDDMKKALYLYSGETPGYVDKVSEELIKLQAHFVRGIY